MTLPFRGEILVESKNNPSEVKSSWGGRYISSIVSISDWFYRTTI